MKDARAQELLDLGNRLYEQKAPFDTLCQEIAENCRPERADFTTTRNMGDDFAAHNSDSFPTLAMRELCSSFSAILRPRDKSWFQATTNNESLDKDPANARFLEYVTSELRSAIYDPRTDLIGATKMADGDFGAFGNCILSVEEAPGKGNRNHLFYRPHHLRDVAWLENELAVVDHLHRKDRMTARVMKRRFGEKVLHENVKRMCEKEPHKEVEVRIVVMPADEYDYVGKDSRAEGKRGYKGKKLPFVICYVDADNCKVLKETGLHDFIFMVARWMRIPNSPYAYSPAAMTMLPDARMAQELSLLILEAGEKAVYPAAIAKSEAIQQANLQAGSLTWSDLEGDEDVRKSMAYLPVEADMRVGFEMRKDVREMIQKACYLDKLALPDSGTQRTAYEIARVIEDHVRNLLPLFEPAEVEYNTKLLDKSFNAWMNMQKFDWSQMPQGLAGKDIFWSFKNPMQQASNRILVTQFQEGLQIALAASQAGLKANPINIKNATMDALRGTDMPATWRASEEEMAAEEQQNAMRQMLAGAMQEASAATQLAGQAGESVQQLQATGLVPHPQGQLALPAPPQRKALPAPARA